MSGGKVLHRSRPDGFESWRIPGEFTLTAAEAALRLNVPAVHSAQ